MHLIVCLFVISTPGKHFLRQKTIFTTGRRAESVSKELDVQSILVTRLSSTSVYLDRPALSHRCTDIAWPLRQILLLPFASWLVPGNMAATARGLCTAATQFQSSPEAWCPAGFSNRKAVDSVSASVLSALPFSSRPSPASISCVSSNFNGTRVFAPTSRSYRSGRRGFSVQALQENSTVEKEYDYDLFTIGAGSGGVRASRFASQYGARVAICEMPFSTISSDSTGGLGGT